MPGDSQRVQERRAGPACEDSDAMSGNDMCGMAHTLESEIF